MGQVDVTSTTVLAALVGGAVSVIISKVFDMLHYKQQHTYALKKELFIKKVNSFEKTVAYWTMVSQMLAQNIMIFKPLLRTDVYYSREQMKNVGESISKHFSMIAEKTQDGFFSIRLYLDISGEYDSTGDLNNFFVGLGELHKVVQERVQIGNELGDTTNEIEEEVLRKEIMEIDKKIKEKLESLESTAKRLSNFFDGYIWQLRKVIKKFE